MAECSCIRGNYNFHAEAVDRETIIYQDLSDWMDDEGYDFPTELTIQITPPTRTTAIPITIKVGEINKISSTSIGGLKDGIYCFETTSCGQKYTRSKAIFPYMECCVKQAWATLGMEHQEKIEQVENYLKLVTINAELNNVQTASKQLKIAKKELENLKCDCNC